MDINLFLRIVWVRLCRCMQMSRIIFISRCLLLYYAVISFLKNIMFVWSFININTQFMSKPIEIIPWYNVYRPGVTCSCLDFSDLFWTCFKLTGYCWLFGLFICPMYYAYALGRSYNDCRSYGKQHFSGCLFTEVWSKVTHFICNPYNRLLLMQSLCKTNAVFPLTYFW